MAHLRSFLYSAWWLATLSALTACQALPAVATTTPPAAPPRLPTATVTAPEPITPLPEATRSPASSTAVVALTVFETTSDHNHVNVGSVAHLTLLAWPVYYGTANGNTTMEPWPDHTVAEMQWCVALDEPCTLTGAWQPFVASPEAAFENALMQEMPLKVDWVGPRTVWVVAQFRDVAGNNLLTVNSQGVKPAPAEIGQVAVELVGGWDEAVPLTAQPAVVQTAVAATQEAFPVSGAVEIAEGRCCAGGRAGEVISLTVGFTATRGSGVVTEMRVQSSVGCASDLAAAPWEPFVTQKTYPVWVAVNWVGFYVSVQYRDMQGHLSPIYCDDISVEGSP